MSDHRGTASLPTDVPQARHLIGDRWDGSRPYRTPLAARGITPRIPSSRSRTIPIPHDPALHRQPHRINNRFGRLKDWRRVATGYTRCGQTFHSAIRIAAFVTV